MEVDQNMVHVKAEDMKNLLRLVVQKANTPDKDLPSFDGFNNNINHGLQAYVEVFTTHALVKTTVAETDVQEYLQSLEAILSATDPRYHLTPLQCTTKTDDGVWVQCLVTFQGIEIIP